MVSRRVLGTGTTDANGCVVLADGYTGTGAGLVDLKAEAVIDESSVVSTPYEVIDGMFLDDGTIDKSSSWSLNGASYSQSDDCVTLSNSTGSAKWVAPKINGSSSGYIDSNSDYCVELDIKNIDATNVSIYLDNSYIDVKNSVSTSDWTHIKLYTSRSESKLYYVIGGTTSSKALSTPVGNVALRIGNSESYQFKNYVLYPI